MKYEVEFTVKELSLYEGVGASGDSVQRVNLIGKKSVTEEAVYGSILLYGLDTAKSPKLGDTLKVTVETE